MTVMTQAIKSNSPAREIVDFGGVISVEGLTREHFIKLSAKYPELQMEFEKNENITIMAPILGGSGIRENKLNRRVGNYCEQHLGGETFSPSCGFDLPDGAVKSPDVAWVSKEKMEKLTADEIENKFVPAVPDFIAEIRSKTDSLKKLKEKMQDTWIANGVKLAWLIDPYKEQAHIYRIDGSIEIINGFDKALSGETIMPGFELQLKEFKLIGK